MREIKCRGKRIDNGEEVCGCPYQVNNVAYILLVFPTEKYGSGYSMTNGKSLKINTAFRVIPETVGQYTGLHDRQGKEAYAPETVGQDISLKYYTIFCKDTGEYEDTRLRFYEDSDPKLEKVKDDKDTNTKTD